MTEIVAVSSPVRPYRTIVNDSGTNKYINRLLIGTATTGLVRIEWVAARYGQIIPPNWGMVAMCQYMDSYIPLRYQVDDAQNLIVKQMIEGDFEWLLLIEHDVILPPDAFIRINKYIRDATIPVVSGLYYTRSRPSEPVLYRGRGTSYYDKWEMGDKVWVDGIPTGIVLIHGGLLRTMWDESEEYQLYNTTTRRVFETPHKAWFDPESQEFMTAVGTSDLEWCSRVIKGEYMRKAGWTDYADREYPFLVDTNIFCKHINPNGEQFP
jgi:hypothetical protein